MATCYHQSCDQPTSGKSRYCRVHKAEAREAWRNMIASKSSERQQRDDDNAALWARAYAAGMAAGEACKPTPMVVGPASITLNGVPLLDRSYFVADGACGFAWVNVHPGNCAFARWAKANRGASKAYTGGMQVLWVSEFDQSLQRKEAFAHAFAAVLTAAGIRAVPGSRMD